MDKGKLITAFVALLENDLIMMKNAARAAHEAATHEESQPENEYDTRGLEASYLAGAQAKRAAEIDEALALFRNTSFKSFNERDPIQATALVKVRLDDEQVNHLLLMPKGGGVKLDFEGSSIQVVTPRSSLGEALLGLYVGDVAEFEVGPKVRECEVLEIG
jgi:transcription elongation GreA/GreB family factor